MMLVIAIVLLFAPCLAAAQPLPLCGDINLDQPLVVNFEFPLSQSTKFCPGTTFPEESMTAPSNWVFTPEASTAADANGTYTVTDQRGLIEVCTLYDDVAQAQILVLSLNQQTLADIFGELTVTFNSVSGSTTTFVVSYGPGGFHIVDSSNFVLGPSPLDSRSPGVWNSTGLERTAAVRLCELTSAGQLADVAPSITYGRDPALGCQDPGQRGAVQYSISLEDQAIENPRNYTLVLVWPRTMNCPCECGDCPGCDMLESDPVVVQVMGTDSTSSTSSTTSTTAAGEPSLGTGAIIGIAAGVCVGLAILIVVVVLCCYWCRNKRMCSAKVAELEHLELSVMGGGGGPVGNEKVSSHQNEDSTDYEPPSNQYRTIAFVVDRLIEVKAEWFTAFKSVLASKHHAKPVVPAFTSQLLKRELDDYLQNENCDCLYLLLKGNLEQHRQNGTTDSSHVPIQRIVQESFLHPSNCEKVVLVQFGVRSPQPKLALANGPRVVNLADLPPDNAHGDSGNRWAETVFRHVRPMLMERHTVLTQAADRATRVTPSEREDASRLQLEVLKKIERNTKVAADKIGQHAYGIRQVEENTQENLEITRELYSKQQKDDYAPSQAVTTTGE